MIEISKGRYWDKPWSLVDGCTRVSPGCDNCWLKAMDHRFHREGPVTFRADRLDIPLKTKKPTVFAVWSDPFHEAVRDVEIDKVFVRMYSLPRHTFLVLTKRPERMGKWIDDWSPWDIDTPMPNLWLGVTAENQEQADKRIPILLSIPAAHRFVSIEPMLGPVDPAYSAFNGADSFGFMEGLDLVILGGETGPHARPCHPDWVRSVRDQCATADVPFFFKGFGRHLPDLKTCLGDLNPGIYRAITGHWARHLDGRQHNDLPW